MLLVTLSKKHRKSHTVQEEGLTNEGRHDLLLLHKLAHDKRGVEEAYKNRAGLSAGEVRIFCTFSRGNITTLEIMPTPSSVNLPWVYFTAIVIHVIVIIIT